MSVRVIVKKGPKAREPLLSVGEPGFITDTFEAVIGTSIGNVPFGISDGDSDSIVFDWKHIRNKVTEKNIHGLYFPTRR